MAAALIVDIDKRFPSGAVVAASFRADLGAGEILVLFGPSGSGKTTILRSIAGLERPDRGTVSFDGEPWFDSGRSVWLDPQRRSAGCVFQAPALFPHLTVQRNIEYGISELPTSDRIVRRDGVLALLDLGGLIERYPQQLSGGQAQRVALARALAPRPRLLLLDEPFAALDAPTRLQLGRLLRAAIERLGISVVLVTHDRNDAMALGDQMAVLAEGRVRQVGPVLDVFRRPADLVVAHAVGVESVLPGRIEHAANGLVDLRVDGGVLYAVDVGLEGGAREVFACIRAEDVTLERVAGPSGSARNHVPGRIVRIEPEGVVERVSIDCGFPLAALVTRQAREEMQLEPGITVVAAIKATAIHLVPRTGGGSRL